MIDNRVFDVTDCEDLHRWLELAAGDRDAVGWAVQPPEGRRPHRLMFFWTKPPDYKAITYHPLPFKASPDLMAQIAKEWLAQVEYPREPDHDGHNNKAFRLYCTTWGHVDGFREVFLAVQPEWGMIGK